MCGIAGLFFFQGNHGDRHKDLVEKMIEQVVHRGPDAAGVYTDEHVALGHRRLSIIDLSTGAQPMSNADKTIWIIFNGEIYNFLELRKEFEKENYPFKTHSDTEILIALYEKYGTSLLDKINGMFAFAIWDQSRKQLFLARDRLGKKPLFYYSDSEKFIFGSELKSLLAEETVPRHVNPESISLFFSFAYIPGQFTILKDVYKLLPGHYMVVSPEKKVINKYWDVEFEPLIDRENRKKYEEELHELLYNAVRRRLISDVPLGSFLSGGVDSSGVVGMMSIIDEIPVKTFTIGYNESDYSEAEDARFIAEYFNTIHEELTVNPSSLDIFPQLVWHFDEPFGDASSISTYYVSKMAREFVTVVLSGDGGDELFAGYQRYTRFNRYDKFRRAPKWLKRYLIAPLAYNLPIDFPGRNVTIDIATEEGDNLDLGIYPYIKNLLFSDNLKSDLGDFKVTLDLFPHIGPVNGLHPLSRNQYLDLKLYLPDDILVKVDKMSMAVSLETRAPLLDYTLAEFAAKLPPEWQLENGSGKAFLKSVLKTYLPERVFNKPKHGFDIPKKHWFRDELRDYARDILLSDKARTRGYFNMNIIDRILSNHAEGKRDYSIWIWSLLNFELWHKTFIDNNTRLV